MDPAQDSTQHTATPDPAALPGVSIACPSCRRLVPVGAPCPSCGDATGALRPRDAPPDSTVVLPPVREVTAELDLAALILDAPPASPASSPSSASPGPARPANARRRALAVLGAAAAVVVVGGAAVAGLRAGGQGPGASSASGSTASAVVPVSGDGVRVTASSTQRPDGRVSYTPANTLDGRPETAWNSDGQGVGADLVYTFPTPVDLRSLTVLNGYQKVLRTGQGARLDLFRLNERVRTFRVVTDAGIVVWDLRDDRAPQTLTHAFGRTRSVRLEVVAVFPSTKYRDLAVSDVSFTAAL